MKKKIQKMLGIGLTLVLSITLALGMAAPVAAQEYEENEWGEWGLPAIEPDTDVGPMAVAPDGTLYASVYDEIDMVFMVQKSEDNGYTWDDTELDDLVAPIAQIVVSPNYEEDETVYVGVWDATVWRLEEAGDATPVALKDIVASDASTPNELFSIDVWYDGDDNWILAGTDIDVFVIRDRVFEDWRDQELEEVGYEVNFAPDFDDSELIWAISQYWDAGVGANCFLITSTVSPGQWGQALGDAVLIEADLDPVVATPLVDLDFPDDYTSDVDEVPTLFAAVSEFADGGGVYMIEGVEAPDPSVATLLMDDEDILSLAISGDIILAGSTGSPEIYISDDLGASWDDVTKMATGEVGTNVLMAPGPFDPDEGVAYASTAGVQSAVSRSDDGGEVWNQTGLIDTEIDEIFDLGFHPDFPDNPTFMMTTGDVTDEVTSLWLTENGDEDEPDYIRVLAGDPAGAPANFEGWFWLVEYAQDADAIYIHGQDDVGDSSIWKSTDEGQTFEDERSVRDGAWINDWVITDSTTIYAATDVDGFYKSVNSGLSWSATDVNGTINDIALSPAFEDDETILLGGTDGTIWLSDDAGDSFDDAEEEDDAGLDGNVFVAFDADYAVEDADGYMLIYVADDAGNILQVGEVEDTDDVDWDDLEDDTNEDVLAIWSGGLQVSSDNALYTIASDTGALWRLLLHEDDSIWEDAADGDLEVPEGLWLTPGTNVLWTIDTDDAELWVLEDTLSGSPTLLSPPDGYRLDREDVVQISWEEMRGIDEDYEYAFEDVLDLAPDIQGWTDDTEITVPNLVGSTEYEWKVRAAPLGISPDTWSSRWSDEWTFHTALGEPPWAPEIYAPGGTREYTGIDVTLLPGFSWETAKAADSYEFVLADNAALASPIVEETVSTTAYQLTKELEYSTTYYWQVRALKGDEAISRWSEIGVFTTIAEPVVPPPAVTVPPPVTLTPPAPVVIPTPIPPYLLWTIIGIGAALIIAVIVLIVRTRRVV